eukprot:COSAG01_NODE_2189_length_8193_cov_47.570917_11_plen_148_part_00
MGSWVEQRTFVTDAPALLAADYPQVAANLSAALARLKEVTPPLTTSPSGGGGGGGGDPRAALVPPPGYRPVRNLSAAIQCGGASLRFGSGGGLVGLERKGVQWASASQPIGQFLYESYTSADFNVFLKDFGSRIGDRGVWPAHTAGK